MRRSLAPREGWRLGARYAAAALAALACAALPAEKPPDPGAAEAEADAVAHEIGLLEEGPAAELVAALGARVAAAAPATAAGLRFHVVSLPETNAFSLPGGSVYVSRGLVAFVRSESELANVIAHEVAHVLGEHAERLEERRQQVRFAALARLAAASLGGRASVAALELEGAGLVARYSRALEREADRAGQQLAQRAGFDPAGIPVRTRSREHLPARPSAPADLSRHAPRRARARDRRGGERFEEVLTRGANVERLDQIALMNALDVGDRLPAGRRVKVVVETPYVSARPGSTSGIRTHASTAAASRSTPISP